METTTNHTQEQPTRRLPFLRRAFRFFRRSIVWIVVIAVPILAFMAGRASMYRAYPELSGAGQGTAILAEVGKLIELPSNETPTIATIKDAASAKQGQPFLAPAENGDVLIVYPNAREAILYRPSSNKIIVVGPVHTTAPPAPSFGPSATSSTYVATTTKSKK